MSEELPAEVAERFEEFWADIVCPDGVWDHDQVKRELYDYTTTMRECSKVYVHVTRGRISKPNTASSAVISLADQFVRDEKDKLRAALWQFFHDGKVAGLDADEFADEIIEIVEDYR